MTDKSKTKDRIKKWDYEEKVWRYVAPATGTKEEFKPKQKIYKAEGGRIGFAHGSKRPKGGWTA